MIKFPKIRLPLPVITPNAATATNTIPEKGTWDSKTEFILSCIGMSVGMGNVWRFPYMAYTNGGGAFFIPYMVLLFLIGQPMYVCECIIGQFSSLGPITLYRFCPAMKGVGIAASLVSLFVSLYFIVFLAYSFMYLIFSCFPTLPWSGCYEWWGAKDNCYIRGEALNLPWCKHLEDEGVENITDGVNCKNWETAGQQFWRIYVLNTDETRNMENIGNVQWKPMVSLIGCWVLVFLCVCRGIKSSGKVVYFTAIIPYITLAILVVVGLTMEGATEGLYYLFVPDWSSLLNITVWRRAATQMFYSLNVAYGGVIMFASYNRFTNQVKRDAIIVSFMDTLTCVASAVAIFSILGNMAFRMKVGIDEVTKSGPGLAFEVVPEALLILPFPQFWCFLFFLMMITLGVDSEFAYVETFLTGIYDEWPILRRHKVIYCFILCLICCLLGIPFCTQGGMYVMEFVDTFAAGNGSLLIAVCEMASFFWIYGLNNFLDDSEFMLGSRPGYFWQVCWIFVDPIFLLVCFTFAMIDFDAVDYGGNSYFGWLLLIGWSLSLCSLLQIPLWLIVAFIQMKRQQRPLAEAFKPTDTWGPSEPHVFDLYKEWQMKPPQPGTRIKSFPDRSLFLHPAVSTQDVSI